MFATVASVIKNCFIIVSFMIFGGLTGTIATVFEGCEG
jgi:hypothetical protein